MHEAFDRKDSTEPVQKLPSSKSTEQKLSYKRAYQD